MFYFILKMQNIHSIATHTPGCDEVGRGALAGSVTAAIVALPTPLPDALKELKDSKKLSEKKRDHFRCLILEHAEGMGIGRATPKEIDDVNILNATFLAMHRAIGEFLLTHPLPLLLVDGHSFKPYQGVRHHCIVKGDEQIKSIAAASILAKTTRDDEMKKLAKKYPLYGWEKNKGYPTAHHRAMIKAHGLTPWHRRSYRPCQ